MLTLLNVKLFRFPTFLCEFVILKKLFCYRQTGVYTFKNKQA